MHRLTDYLHRNVLYDILIHMKENLLNISEASTLLGVSVDTLRRWDKSGKLVAIRKDGGTHRYYTKRDLDTYSSDLLGMANEWAFTGSDLRTELYCQNSSVFQARLMKMQGAILDSERNDDFVPLIVAIAGEIGNNSFDHNLGNWPDVVGIFFGYDVNKKEIVLADRGVGILKTLQRVRPALDNNQAALSVAFTEAVTGRAPEKRGNGLNFVLSTVTAHPINLFFQGGDAELRIQDEDTEFRVTKSQITIRGCLARITY